MKKYDPQTYDRWLEISFYYFCKDMLTKTGSLLDLLDMVEAFAPIGKYDSLLVKQLMQETVSSYRLQPSKEELILLCMKYGVPVRKLRDMVRVGNNTIYKLIEEDKEDPRVFFPRLNTDQLKLIHQFMTALEIIRKAGL